MDPTLLFADAKPALEMNLRIPLSIMHFLEFAIWGAWWVVLGNYLNSLGFSRKHIGRIYATIPIGSVIAPMFVGTIADRYFASEHVMAVSHLLGGVLLLVMSQIKKPMPFFIVALLYALTFAPTLAIVNSIVFAQPQVDAERDFPTIRVLGTIGWILAGWSLRLVLKPDQPMNNRPILIAAGLSLVLGVFCFFLPHTPPSTYRSVKDAVVSDIDTTAGTFQIKNKEEKPKEKEDEKKKPEKFDFAKIGVAAGDEVDYVSHTGEGQPGSSSATGSVKEVKGDTLIVQMNDKNLPPSGDDAENDFTIKTKGKIPFLKALDLFKTTSFAVFFGVSFVITIGLAFYFSFTALYLESGVGVKSQNVSTLMTIGQLVEIIFMFSLPWFLREMGMKWVLICGMAAWVLRYALFSVGRPFALVLLGIALHGICFDFFFAAGFIYVENSAPKDIQASGQALFAVLTYGLGMWIGSEASGWLNAATTTEHTDPETGAIVRETNWSKFWLVPCIGVLICLAVFVALF